MSDLPIGWVKAAVPDVIFFQEGPGLRKYQYRPKGTPFLNIRTFSNERIDRSKCQYLDSEEVTEKYGHFLVQAGDILVATSGSLGKIAIAHECDLPLVLNTSITRFRPIDAQLVNHRFVYWFLKSEGFMSQAREIATGSAQLNFGPSHIAKFSLPLPPLAEQRRIVAKLDSLTARTARARTELDRIPKLIAKYKQAILEKAFSAVSSPSVALKTVTTKIGSGFTPRGGASAYANSGTPFIRSQNVYFEGFSNAGLVYVDSATAASLSNVVTQERDVLLNITGASIGRACIVPTELVGGRVNQHVAIIRCTKELLPEYLFYYLWSPAIQDWIGSENYGVTRQALTKGMIEDLSVPLRSLDAQKQIVTHIETAMVWLDKVAAEHARASHLLPKLDQAILAKAFRGELVPQDPNDEPASVLLERIKANGTRVSQPTKRKQA